MTSVSGMVGRVFVCGYIATGCELNHYEEAPADAHAELDAALDIEEAGEGSRGGDEDRSGGDRSDEDGGAESQETGPAASADSSAGAIKGTPGERFDSGAAWLEDDGGMGPSKPDTEASSSSADAGAELDSGTETLPACAAEDCPDATATGEPGDDRECSTGELMCDEDTPLGCDASGKWVARTQCEFGCSEGECAECAHPSLGCIGNVPVSCGADGTWLPQSACSGDKPVCDAGGCVGVCEARNDCGLDGTENCCVVATVTGGDFNRRNDSELPATVTSFSLEVYEVTVGRFREFVEAYPESRPAAGDGAHLLITNSGWRAEWDTQLAQTQEELVTQVTSACSGATVITYSTERGANERRAVNCVSWYEAFAYCAWMGGRLPTSAELSFASAGGAQQRVYPWSVPNDVTTIDATFATFEGNECPPDTVDNSACISSVGTKAPGVGRFGHFDLLGNVAEFVLDTSAPSPTECEDCAALEETGSHLILGGAYDFDSASALRNGGLRSVESRSQLAGIRCARLRVP